MAGMILFDSVLFNVADANLCVSNNSMDTTSLAIAGFNNNLSSLAIAGFNKNLSSARGFYMVSLSRCSYLLQSSTSWMDTPHRLTISCLPSVLLITII
jgi:hypothetical protein